MLAHVLVVSTTGRAVPQDRLDLLAEADQPDLPFVPTAHHRWTDTDRSVAWAGWQAFTDTFDLGSHWHVSPSGDLTAFSGHLWPNGQMWAPGSGWAEQLAAHLRDRPLGGGDPALDGVFTALSIDAGGRGTLATDAVSLGLLYQAAGQGIEVFASHPALAARLVSPSRSRPARDPLGPGWLAYLGYPTGTGTGFDGVSCLATGSSVAIDPRWGARVIGPDQPPWPSSSGGRDPDPFAAVHQDLLASVASIAALPGRSRVADLTGGKDSRLILALLLEAGLTDRFRFRTVGSSDSADVIAARKIAETYDLAHDVIDPGTMAAPDFRRRLLTHVFQSSGMLNAWDLKGMLGVQRNPVVSGMAGELLRSSMHASPPPASLEEMLRRFHVGAQCDTGGLLRPEARAWYEAQLHGELLHRLTDAGAHPLDHLDAFYVSQRLHRWAGATLALDNGGVVLPLSSVAGLHAASAIGADRRITDEVHFEVMRRAAPALARLPFANDRWSPELLSRVDGGAAYGAEPIRSAAQAAPGRLAARRAARAPSGWQAARLDDNRSTVRELLLDDRSNPVFDVLDRRAVTRVVGRARPTTFQGRLQLYGALTAAAWLGGHELPQRFGDD